MPAGSDSVFMSCHSVFGEDAIVESVVGAGGGRRRSVQRNRRIVEFDGASDGGAMALSSRRDRVCVEQRGVFGRVVVDDVLEGRFAEEADP